MSDYEYRNPTMRVSYLLTPETLVLHERTLGDSRRIEYPLDQFHHRPDEVVASPRQWSSAAGIFFLLGGLSIGGAWVPGTVSIFLGAMCGVLWLLGRRRSVVFYRLGGGTAPIRMSRSPREEQLVFLERFREACLEAIRDKALLFFPGDPDSVERYLKWQLDQGTLSEEDFAEIRKQAPGVRPGPGSGGAGFLTPPSDPATP